MGLMLNKAKLQQELNFCHTLASQYFERESKFKLKNAADQLDFISKSPISTYKWQIDKANPLQIKCNDGHHEISGAGKNLQGRISFIWGLRKINTQTLELVGNASTIVAIHECTDSEVKDDHILKWKVDVATKPDAPGPAFHIQIDNPENVPVPRFPSLLFSPADCLDFLLGELFQDEWKSHQLNKFIDTRRFAAAQRSRLCSLLDSQKSELNKPANSSAWIALKNWEPADDTFLS